MYIFYLIPDPVTVNVATKNANVIAPEVEKESDVERGKEKENVRGKEIENVFVSARGTGRRRGETDMKLTGDGIEDVIRIINNYLVYFVFSYKLAFIFNLTNIVN